MYIIRHQSETIRQHGEVARPSDDRKKDVGPERVGCNDCGVALIVKISPIVISS